MDIFPILRPLLFRLDPERAHKLALTALKLHLVPGVKPPAGGALAVQCFGLTFPNPVGLAAGFDKDGRVPAQMMALGFGFVEVGTVTPLPQSGNPRPRLFRLDADRAVINRMGFNNQGLAEMRRRLEKFQNKRKPGGALLGVNIGANRGSDDPVADYCKCLGELIGLADYFTVNISSPNTPGLRDLQQAAALERLIAALQDTRAQAAARRGVGAPPLLVKIAPDLSAQEVRDIAAVALDKKIEGLIVANTTTGHRNNLLSPDRDQAGGLSGAPLSAPAETMLRDFYRATDGRLPLIGVGGLSSGAGVYDRIRAGATLVQIYTAMLFEGPYLAVRVLGELAERLDGGGLSTIAEAVGASHRS